MTDMVQPAHHDHLVVPSTDQQRSDMARQSRIGHNQDMGGGQVDGAGG